MEGARRFTQDEKRCALERQEYMCGGCGQDLWEEHIGFGQGHHILPYSMGGGTTMENLVVLCPSCHVYYDNLAMCGRMYDGDYHISQMDESQIRDQYLYEQSHFLALRNKKNQQIKKTIWRYQKRLNFVE